MIRIPNAPREVLHTNSPQENPVHMYCIRVLQKYVNISLGAITSEITLFSFPRSANVQLTMLCTWCRRRRTCKTVSPRKMSSLATSSTIRSCIISQRSPFDSSDGPAPSALAGGARRSTFQMVFSLSRVVPAVDSCVTFATKSYIVEVPEEGGSRTAIDGVSGHKQPIPVHNACKPS